MRFRVRVVAVVVWCVALLGIAAPSSAQVSYWASFQTHNGTNWLTAEGGGGWSNFVVADRTSAGAWETFEVVDEDGGSLLDGDHVIIKANNGSPLWASCNSASSLRAGGGIGCFYFNTGPWHFFLLKNGGSGGSTINSGDQVAIMAWSGYTVIADWGGGSTVNCNSTHPWGPHETFTIYF
jgi:hypothetical protein